MSEKPKTADEDKTTPEPGRLSVADFLSAGPCRQRPGMRTARGQTITTCPECPGLMRAGECARDALKGELEK